MTEWPDWQGQTTVIVGTGPSASNAPLEQCRNKCRVIVIKRSWMLAPWADALYGIDKGWWIANHGAPGFEGLKFSPSPTACRVFKLQQVVTKPRAEILTGTTILQDRRVLLVLGCGLRSGGGYAGFQALNLAYQFGSRRMVLVGFDMRGAHWHQDYRGVGQPDAGRTETWRKALDGCAEHFRNIGLTVLNATPGSALRAYPMVELTEATG